MARIEKVGSQIKKLGQNKKKKPGQNERNKNWDR